MNFFKDSGIILKINNSSKEFLYTVYSLRFGKIIVKRKKNKKGKVIDIGYHINYELKIKNSISIIQNIIIINELYLENKNFSQLYFYMLLLKIVNSNTEFGVPNNVIFDILNQVNKYKKNDLEIKLVLACLKILNLLGILNVEHKNIMIKKILNFISKNSFSKIIKLTGINASLKEELKKVIYIYLIKK